MAAKSKTETAPAEPEAPAEAAEETSERRAYGPSHNQVNLTGRLTRDPQLRRTPKGTAVASLGLATGDREMPEGYDEFHEIVVWGKQAEAAAKYLRKGRLVQIEGRLQGRSWADRDGNKRRSVEIVARSVIFLPGQRSQQDAEQAA